MRIHAHRTAFRVMLTHQWPPSDDSLARRLWNKGTAEIDGCVPEKYAKTKLACHRPHGPDPEIDPLSARDAFDVGPHLTVLGFFFSMAIRCLHILTRRERSCNKWRDSTKSSGTRSWVDDFTRLFMGNFFNIYIYIFFFLEHFFIFYLLFFKKPDL